MIQKAKEGARKRKNRTDAREESDGEMQFLKKKKKVEIHLSVTARNKVGGENELILRRERERAKIWKR